MASHSSFEGNSAFTHQAKKRFGQNFLNNPDIIERIVRSIAPTAKDNLVGIESQATDLQNRVQSCCSA